ncbi:hypothetical protein QVD17_00153 [Tagetes erecta]|uniref:Uncharacterized protein n=1 Tax=Tagetes erecta TaxID=13708 RepID=A0AAD8L4H7_TARER|nr:hypothetical protein QVD17_00153 [Tagetes erecta]
MINNREQHKDVRKLHEVYKKTFYSSRRVTQVDPFQDNINHAPNNQENMFDDVSDAKEGEHEAQHELLHLLKEKICQQVTPRLRIHKTRRAENIIGDVEGGVETRSKVN